MHIVIIGGGIAGLVDSVRLATGSAFAAYSSLFGMEALMLMVALYLSTQLNSDTSRAHTEEAEALSGIMTAD